MLNTYRYTLIAFIRMPGIMIWALCFPLILATIFVAMFTPIEDMAAVDEVGMVVVEPDDSPDGQAFSQFIDGLSVSDSPYQVVYANTAEEAERLVRQSVDDDGSLFGFVELKDGMPHVSVAGATSSDGIEELMASMIVLAMDQYVANASLIKGLMAESPSVLSDPQVVASIFEPIQATAQVQLTQNQPKETVRFYFALLGMAALFGGSVGLAACQRLRPNSSAVGARRSVGATNHGVVVAATVLASWTICFACLLVAFCYLRFVAGVDFGGRDVLCVGAIAASSLTATALGCAVSAIPKLSGDAKSGILTGIVCFASLFAGLYGQPTMQLADDLAVQFPLLSLVNPASQIAQSFYAIMYYDSLAPYAFHLAVLLGMAVVLFMLSVRSLRRQRYASL